MIGREIKIILSNLTRPAIAILPASALILALFVFVPSAHAVSQTKQDIQELQRNVFVLQSDIADLKDKLRDMPSASDVKQIRQSQADLLTQIQDLLRQVQVLTGRFEESRFYTDKTLKQTTADMDVLKSEMKAKDKSFSKKDADELITRVKNIEAQMKSMDDRLAALEKVVEVPAEESTETEATEAKTPEEQYNNALEVFNKHKYPEARKMMEDFIKENPNDKLAGNAQFWVGDSYYAEKKYPDAILAYEDLLQKYKGHDKIPAALLKQAYAFLEMGDKKAAKGILTELVANYPDTEQGKTAKDKLDSLEGKKIAPPKTPPAEPAGPPAPTVKPKATK